MKLWLSDLWVSSRYALVKSMGQTKRNMSMMFYAVPYVMALVAYVFVAPMLTFLAGILLQLIVAACLADYMDYIRSIVLFNMSDAKEHKRNFRSYFRTAFILFMLIWFVDYAFQLLIAPLLGALLPFLLVIPFTFILYGALLMTPYFESLYIGNEEIGSAFSEVKSFMKRNAWVWIINGIALVLGLFLLGSGIGQVLSNIPMPELLRPFITILIQGAIFQFMLGFLMLYRGNLYDILNKGSRQARVMRLLNQQQPPKAS